MRTARPHRSRAMPARKATRSRAPRRPLALEPLEARTLLTANLVSEDLLLSTHGGACQCPVCTGIGLDEIPVVTQESTLAAATTSLAGLPTLSSNSSAAKKLYLDFNGHVQSSWGSFSNVVTPAFDQDGNPSSLSTGELAAIREIWTRVAEDYAPFNINVTTVDPGTASSVARVAIGGHYSDWYGSSAGGVAYVGGFASTMPNVAYVFEDALGNGNPRYVAEAASHEAGHLFGLQHQAVWSGSTLVSGYNSGTDAWAPIMGTGYYAQRTTWHRGTPSTSSTAMQDDMSVLAGVIGWRADDVAGTTTAATALAGGTSVNLAGIISGATDVDLWRFTTSGGSLSLQLAGAQYGGNLDAVLELRNASGQTIASSSPTNSLGASLSKTLTSGTYYVAARSSGGYGNAGQYKLTGTLPPALVSATSSTAPEISVRVSGSELVDGGTASFGTTSVGTPVTRIFTVTNVGSGTLSLTALSSSAMPAGFSLVSNLSDLTLTAGQSTSFSVRFNATTAGTFSGQIAVRSNDSNEGTFDVRLSASATTSTPSPTVTTTSTTTLLKRTLDNGSAGYTQSGAWTAVTGRGVASDMSLAARGTGSTSATWSFTSIPNGKYQVYGSWLGASTNATNAPFTLYNGSTPVTTVRTSQRVNSSGLTADGANWKLLGTVTVTGGRLNVRLNNQADGTVVADAIRIVQTASTSAADLAAADLGLLAWLDDRHGGEVHDLTHQAAIEEAPLPDASRMLIPETGEAAEAARAAVEAESVSDTEESRADELAAMLDSLVAGCA